MGNKLLPIYRVETRLIELGLTLEKSRLFVQEHLK